jgi:hypothetical protein
LTSFPKKSEFEAVVIALVYTIIINTIVEIFGAILVSIGKWFVIGEWDQLSKTAISIIIALIIGLLWSYLYNNDIIHNHLRKLKITNQTSYPSEWYGTFSEIKSYIILNLKDERRIMGWPVEWPNDPEKGHFVLENAMWLIIGPSEKPVTIPLETIDKILIAAHNVEIVEFVKDEETEGGDHDES